MRIGNVRVYDLKESILASGFPRQVDIDFGKFENQELTQQDIDRAVRLANSKNGSGHDSFLKGILVSMNITFPQYWLIQMDRYHFIDIVSSTSKMNSISKMIDQLSEFSKEAIKKYNNKEINIDQLMQYIPLSLTLTARFTTNYLQLKTIYSQRKFHKSKEWQEFCSWIDHLPMSELICNFKEEVN